MSLKAVHIAFIVCASLLAGIFGLWALDRSAGSAGHLAAAVVAFAGALGLVVYGVWFVRKLKGVSYL